ncbi:MAG: hypothetical protein HGB36_04190 [Chlorobiaceae bacterium]|jgi:hypothetical protein|nr:hypothetical protein [Chlorobiaceae bacterium]
MVSDLISLSVFKFFKQKNSGSAVPEATEMKSLKEVNGLGTGSENQSTRMLTTGSTTGMTIPILEEKEFDSCSAWAVRSEGVIDAEAQELLQE